jgi:hypothetical protein
MDHAFRFENAEVIHSPFLHFVAPDFLDEEVAQSLLEWFEHDAVWVEKNVANFYESHDLSLRASTLPTTLQFLIDEDFLTTVREHVTRKLNAKLGTKTDVTAHRLQPGDRIAIHSDFGELKQTHRLLIQVNRGWSLENGGMLMFMANEHPDGPSENDCYYIPEHRAAFCFEVSPKSLHAVSRVLKDYRYTLCLSFYGDENEDRNDNPRLQ